MRTNIKRAIDDLLTLNKEIMLAAYLRAAGYMQMSVCTLVVFEHTLYKCPTHPDKSRHLRRGVFGISAEYWSTKPNVLALANVQP